MMMMIIMVVAITLITKAMTLKIVVTKVVKRIN